MRIGVVTDASCDLPTAFLRRHRVGILPITICLGDERVLDERDPSVTSRLYSGELAQRLERATTLLPTTAQIREYFLQHLVLDYDYVFCITSMASHSPMYDNATKAAFQILDDYRRLRTAAGVTGPFGLRLLDSGTAFAGTGLLVAEACRLIESGLPANEIRQQLEALREHICAYLIPHDPLRLRLRAGEHQDAGTSWRPGRLKAALGFKPVLCLRAGRIDLVGSVRGHHRALNRLFRQVADALNAGGDLHYVVVGYGGDPTRLQQLPGYQHLVTTTQQLGTELLVSMMSASGAVHTGHGCVSIAWSVSSRASG